VRSTDALSVVAASQLAERPGIGVTKDDEGSTKAADVKKAAESSGPKRTPAHEKATEVQTQDKEHSADETAASKAPELRSTELSIRLDPEINRVVVQVIDSKTKTVLRSIPPEDVIKVLKDLQEKHGRRLVDEEA